MKRLLNIFYIAATMLIIVGALLIFQNTKYGLTVLASGLIVNIIYRLISMPWRNLLKLRPAAVIKFLSVLILGFACMYIYSSDINKFNLLIIAIVIDVIVNIKEDSKK